jgi:hypothetical protein
MQKLQKSDKTNHGRNERKNGIKLVKGSGGGPWD